MIARLIRWSSVNRFLVLLATIGFTVHLYVAVPKGFFPQQDSGRLMGAIQADQDTSFAAMADKVQPRPESLTPASRLKTDSIRSPITAVELSRIPSATACSNVMLARCDPASFA